MILKGNQRAGGRQMALHLLNGEQNEHVRVHEVSGFMADDVLGALNEAYALSKGTKCKQFMYSLSLNPPQDEYVSIEIFEGTLERIEKKLGLEGQPRVIVFHEKEGRRHAHCVWSRIDTEEMKAVNIAHPKRKLNDIAKSLYLENGWQMPDGFRDKSKKNPLNYTRAEWQQAMRAGRRPASIKRELQECWAVSDDKKSFENSLWESGYILAKGDRRGFVAIDLKGEVYSLPRALAQKSKTLESRIGKAEKLRSVDQAKERITGQLSKLFKRYEGELNQQHQKQMAPLLNKKQIMTKEHRAARADLDVMQDKRWQVEESARSARIRNGFKGLWDKLNGRYWKNRKVNEHETWQAHLRDKKEREELIYKQLIERQNLQIQFNLLRQSQEKERAEMIRDLSHFKTHEKKKARVAKRSKSRGKVKDQDHDIGFEEFDLGDQDIDFEPEI